MTALGVDPALRCSIASVSATDPLVRREIPNAPDISSSADRRTPSLSRTRRSCTGRLEITGERCGGVTRATSAKSILPSFLPFAIVRRDFPCDLQTCQGKVQRSRSNVDPKESPATDNHTVYPVNVAKVLHVGVERIFSLDFSRGVLYGS